MDLIYWLSRLCSKRGGDGVTGVDGVTEVNRGYRYFSQLRKSPYQSTLLEFRGLKDLVVYYFTSHCPLPPCISNHINASIEAPSIFFITFKFLCNKTKMAKRLNKRNRCKILILHQFKIQQ